MLGTEVLRFDIDSEAAIEINLCAPTNCIRELHLAACNRDPIADQLCAGAIATRKTFNERAHVSARRDSDSRTNQH